MNFQVWYAESPIGRVELLGPDPVAAWLEPMAGYAQVREAVVAAGDAHWEHWRSQRYRVAQLSARGEVAAQRAAEIQGQLTVRTEQGERLNVASLTLWDSRYTPEGPFVIVYRQGQVAPVGARLESPPSRGSDGSRPAA